MYSKCPDLMINRFLSAIYEFYMYMNMNEIGSYFKLEHHHHHIEHHLELSM